MRPKSIFRQFFLLLVLVSTLVVVFAIQLTYQFGQYSQSVARQTQKLQLTFELNQELRQDIRAQMDLLRRQLERMEPDFVTQFSEKNFLLGEKQIRYLKLDIEERERLTVERIKSLQSELGVLSMQFFQFLQSGDSPSARQKLVRIQDLDRMIDQEFTTLNGMQVIKLRELMTPMDYSVTLAYRTIYGFTAGLFLALMAMAFFFRRRILYPVQSILEATDQMRQGNFAARASVRRADEIGRIATAFNFMAESLQESYAGLERKVEERTRQLQELQQQLVQAAKMSAVGQLVSGAAHELNNPLTAIMGFTELVRRNLAVEQRGPQDIRRLDEIYAQADRCRRIVANLLQFARQQEPHREVVRINDVVDQVIQLRVYELETRNIQIVREFDPANPRLLADPHKIQQVVLNIFNNAHDAIRDTGRPGTIWVRTRAQANQVLIEICDDGAGIREPERVFEPFYTTKEVGRGTGLGLSVCYGIIQEHHGEIRAENWEKGARFLVTLPLGDLSTFLSATPEGPEPVSVDSAAAPRVALIVDDEESLVSLQASFLATLGFKTEGARNGEEALRKLQSQPVDLIISDVRMPGSIDGLQLYNRVQKNWPHLAKRFAFVTGDVVGMNTEQVFIDPSVPRIQKPFKFEAYAHCIRQILEK